MTPEEIRDAICANPFKATVQKTNAVIQQVFSAITKLDTDKITPQQIKEQYDKCHKYLYGEITMAEIIYILNSTGWLYETEFEGESCTPEYEIKTICAIYERM